MAQAFDPERGQLKGDAHPVAERIASDSDGHYGFFDVSENGVLIYQAGDLLRERRITWFDRAGKELGAGEKGSYDTVRLSPDGAKLAFNAGDPNNDIWVDELARGVHMRLTNDPGTELRQSDLVAGRKPDSVQCCGQISAGHLPDEFQRGRWQGAAAGEGDLRSVDLAHELVSRWQVHPLRARKPLGPIQQDVWVLPLAGDRKPRLFVQNAFNGQFSPDGRWVAYTSLESGKAADLRCAVRCH